MLAQSTTTLEQCIKGLYVNDADMLICAFVSQGAFAGLATKLASKHIEGKQLQKLRDRFRFSEPGTRSIQLQQAVCAYLCTSSKTGLSTM